MRKLIVLILVLIASQNLFAQSGWQWVNPTPSGSGLNDVTFFTPQYGYAVGYNGTILCTTDFGENWQTKNYNKSLNLNSVVFTDINTGYITAHEQSIGSYLSAVILRTTDKGNSWTQVYYNSSLTVFLSKIYFINSNTGFALTGDNYFDGINNSSFILKTTNGGLSWTQFPVPITIAMNCISFINENTGVIAGKWGKVIRTTNAGNSWSDVSYGTITYNDIFFKSSDTVFAVGYYGTFVKSVNGGVSWDSINGFHSKNLSSIIFSNSSEGYIAGGNIFKTTNAGLTWDSLTADFKSSKIILNNSNKFFSIGYSSTSPFVYDNANQIFKSTNRGLNWINTKSSITNKYLNSMDFINDDTGFIVGESGTILKTTNKWDWIQSASFTINNLNSIKFFDENTGIVVGSGSAAYRTTNAGESWYSLSSGGSAEYYFLNFINSSTGFFCGYIFVYPGSTYGGVEKTTDKGENWTTIFSGSGAVSSVSFINSNTGWISISNSRVLKTTNSGNNWVTSFTGNFYAYITYLNFINEQTGYMSYTHSSGADGIYKTTDGGFNWTRVINSSASLNNKSEMKFFNENTGYLCTIENFYVTSNGGNTWKGMSNSEYMPFLNNVGLYDFHFFNMNTGIMIGSYGTILKTTTGGNVFVSQMQSELPKQFLLHQNYPNPFNPSTKINYELKLSGFVSLKVFDLLGKEVASLVNEKQNAGIYAVDFNSAEFNLPSGIYFYTLNAGEFNETKKMVLVK